MEPRTPLLHGQGTAGGRVAASLGLASSLHTLPTHMVSTRSARGQHAHLATSLYTLPIHCSALPPFHPSASVTQPGWYL